MASKNKKFNIKHLGGNIDSSESAKVTKDYEVRSFISFIQERENKLFALKAKHFYSHTSVS